MRTIRIRYVLAPLACISLLAGCAPSVSNPQNATIFDYDQKGAEEMLRRKQASVDELNREADQLHMQTAQAQQQVDASRAKRDVLLARVNQLNSDLDALSARINASKRLTAEAKAKQRRLQAKIREVKADIEACQRQSAQAAPGQDTAELEKRLNELRRRHEQLLRDYEASAGL